jgi:hypothetical protein
MWKGNLGTLENVILDLFSSLFVRIDLCTVQIVTEKSYKIQTVLEDQV